MTLESIRTLVFVPRDEGTSVILCRFLWGNEARTYGMHNIYHIRAYSQISRRPNEERDMGPG